MVRNPWVHTQVFIDNIYWIEAEKVGVRKTHPRPLPCCNFLIPNKFCKVCNKGGGTVPKKTVFSVQSPLLCRKICTIYWFTTN